MPDGRMPEATDRGVAVRIEFDGQRIDAFAGETVAAALWAAGILDLRRSTVAAEPRGVYCAMGICYDCLVRVDGREVRACMTGVRDGLVVERGG
ncbi:MAG: (2Fe-2S)-binding protein [Planctomycetota bacterium]